MVERVISVFHEGCVKGHAHRRLAGRPRVLRNDSNLYSLLTPTGHFQVP